MLSPQSACRSSRGDEVKPPIFDYIRPATLDEAASILSERGVEAKILAGGQSLVPLLNFRMLRPSILVDINAVPNLSYVRENGDGLRIGATTRHYAIETSPLVRERFPVLTQAMTHVAHLAVRNRGTIGGSLSHADPAAELPMMAVLLDAEIHTRTKAGTRMHAAREFFIAPLTTVLEDDEIVTEIVLPPLPPRCGWAFEEFSQRTGDFAIAAVAATLDLNDGTIADARVAVTGVDETPLRLRDAEAELVGQRCSQALFTAVAQKARTAVQPNSDLRASADYRRHLVEALTERALASACRRAKERRHDRS
jgi:carbon-monoxide dehydrogenase medium subunit